MDSSSIDKSVMRGLMPAFFHAALAGAALGLHSGGFTQSICSTRLLVFSFSRLNRFFAGIFQPSFLAMLGSCL